MSTRVYGSLARIADFANSNFDVVKLDRSQWASGDYVEGEVLGLPTDLYRIEDRQGHMIKVEPGDWVVGALGDRAATLEVVGSWRDIGDDGVMAPVAYEEERIGVGSTRQMIVTLATRGVFDVHQSA